MARILTNSMRLILPVMLLTLLVPVDGPALADNKDRYSLRLILADAALDKDGNLYVIVNTWTSDVKNLVRILPDHSIDRGFRLARFDECCTVDPFLVNTDEDGNIYILTYVDNVSNFVLAKYNSEGELDEYYAEAGVVHFPLITPVDMDVSADGVVYILDTQVPEVYVVSQDGMEILEFVSDHYDMIRPAKIELGPNREIYVFDLFDTIFGPYETSQGIVALEPDGEPVYSFGSDWEGINSEATPLNYASMVVDADGSLWVLGPYEGAGPLGGAYHFDANGYRIGMTSLDYRLGDQDNAVGIITDNESGFIIFEIENVSIVVMRYDPDGKVREKFSAEVFKRPF